MNMEVLRNSEVSLRYYQIIRRQVAEVIFLQSFTRNLVCFSAVHQTVTVNWQLSKTCTVFTSRVTRDLFRDSILKYQSFEKICYFLN